MKSAGYSSKPLFKKLGVKAGQSVWFSGAPDGYEDELRRAGAFERKKSLAAGLDFIHLFTGKRAVLEAELPKLRDSLQHAGTIWISWPKKSAKVPTDLDENAVREIGLKARLVDVKVCAVDETWSGLKFVFRVKDR